MTDDDRRAASTRRIEKRADVALLRHRTVRPLLEFDALAAYLGLLLGATLGAASPAAVPVLTDAATQFCVVGALEVGRDGVAECRPAR